MELSAAIRSRRDAEGWRQEDLAHFSGLSKGAIDQLETGRRRDPHLSTLFRLAGAFKISLPDLLRGIDPSNFTGAYMAVAA